MVDIQSAAASVAAATTLTAPALTVVQVAITDMSQALTDLNRFIQTNATPVTMSPDGNAITLTTSLGNITVTLAQQLSVTEKQNLTQQLMNLIQTQKPLTLTIPAGSPPTQAVLLLPTPSTATPTTPTPPTNAQPILPTSSAVPLAAGNEFPAVVLPNNIAPPPSAALTTAPQILNLAATASPAPEPFVASSSATISVNPGTLLSTETAAPTVISAPVTQAPQISGLQATQFTEQQTAQVPIQPFNLQNTPASQQTAITQPSVINNPQPVAQPSSTLLQPGAQVIVRVVSVLSPDQTPPSLASNQMLATVTATGTSGNLVLKAGDMTLFVKAPAATAVGTQLIITVDPAKNAPALVIRPMATNNFPILPQALAELAQISPQIAAQVFASAIPQPTAALPGALMFLFNAFKQGNVRGWLGDDAIETLTRFGKSEIVNALSRNLSEAGQSVQDPIVGEWKAYPIPLYAQQQFQALNLYVHSDRDAHRGEGEPAKTTPNTVRFLIDMRLSKLGNMQVDGFVQNKKLDMVLRSEVNLPNGLHNELRAAYIRAVGAVGYAGTLSFQIGRRHWMVMQPPPVKGIVT